MNNITPQRNGIVSSPPQYFNDSRNKSHIRWQITPYGFKFFLSTEQFILGALNYNRKFNISNLVLIISLLSENQLPIGLFQDTNYESHNIYPSLMLLANFLSNFGTTHAAKISRF